MQTEENFERDGLVSLVDSNGPRRAAYNGFAESAECENGNDF
jgi:hypothetical protein